MQRLLAHLLLCVALIVQGLGAVCAYGPMKIEMGSQAQAAHSMTAMAKACEDAQACPSCKGDRMAAQDCMQSCSMPAGLSSVSFCVPQPLLRDALVLRPAVSLVNYSQVPPTPPPIA